MKLVVSGLALFLIALSTASTAVKAQQRAIAVESIEKMKTLSTSPQRLDGRVFQVTGLRGGFFVFDKESKARIDSGTVFGGPNSVGRFIRQHDGSAFHVKWFGAVPNDGRDDQPALQAAINAAVAQTRGQEGRLRGGIGLEFGGGTYDLSAPLTIGSPADGSPSHLNIKGAGRKTTVLRAIRGAQRSSLPFLVQFAATNRAQSNSFWTVQGIAFLGTNGKEIGGINAMMSSYWAVKDCTFTHTYPGIKMRNWSTLVDRCRFEFGGDNVHLSRDAGIGGQQTINDLVFTNCSFASGRYGIRSDAGLDVNNLKVLNCQFDGPTHAGILINGSCDLLQIKNSYFEAQGQAGTARVNRQYLTGREKYWRNQTTYGTNTIVRSRADGRHYICVAGGKSNGTDRRLANGSDRGCQWIAQSTEVNGAIVLHPTRVGIPGASGEISGNVFFNCDRETTISASGLRRFQIVNNYSGGDKQKNFVTFQNAAAFPSGPLPYTTTQHVVVDGSRLSLSGKKIYRKLVEFQGANLNGHAGVTIRERAIAGTTSSNRPFYLNDLTTDLWRTEKDNTSQPIRRLPAGDGTIGFQWSKDKANVVAVLTKDQASPLSGQYFTLHGDIVGDDGNSTLALDVFDGHRRKKTLAITSREIAMPRSSRRQVVFLEPAPQVVDWAADRKYAIGDVVRARSDGKFYKATSAGSSRGSDTDLAGGSDLGVQWTSTLYERWEPARSYEIGDRVRTGSKPDDKYYVAVTAGMSKGSDADLPGGSDRGVKWRLSSGDPTEEIVILHVRSTGSTATTCMLRNFCFASSAYDPQTYPILAAPSSDRLPIRLSGRDYGMVANDSQSDSRALRKLISDGSKLGLPIFIPRGRYILPDWKLITLTSDLQVSCADGCEIIGPDPALSEGSGTLLELTAAGGTSLKWTGGTIKQFDRFLNLPRVDGTVTPQLLLQDIEFENVLHVVEDIPSQSPGVVEQARISGLRIRHAESPFVLSSQRFVFGRFEDIRIRDLRNVSGDVPITGFAVGKDHADSVHGRLVFRNIEIDTVTNNGSQSSRGMLINGDHAMIERVTIRNVASNKPFASEAIRIQSANGVIRNCDFLDVARGQATICVVGRDRGETHRWQYRAGPTALEHEEIIAWNSGRSNGRLLRVGATQVAVQLLSGRPPKEKETFVGRSSGAVGIVVNRPREDRGASGHGVRIDECRVVSIKHPDSKAILISTSDCAVTNCSITGGGTAIDAKGNRCVISNNTFIGCLAGGLSSKVIVVEGKDNRITHNVLTRCGSRTATLTQGIVMESEEFTSCQNIVSNNVIENLISNKSKNSTQGVVLVGPSAGNLKSTGTVISGNVFRALHQGIDFRNTERVDHVVGAGNVFMQVATKGNSRSATRVSLGIHHFSASRAPSVHDDASMGYSTGSRWINQRSADEFVCVDASIGKARWRSTTGARGDVSTLPVQK